MIRHSCLDELENRIIQYRGRYKKIWYVIDGVYSMYGDFAPISELLKLTDKYKQLYLYVDDAHGMSWIGQNGTGYFLSQTTLHPKIILATSLAKGFGSCGGVFVFPNNELRDKVKNWGGPLTYSGPQQPATIGASIASAKIHLSDEIYALQRSLKEKIAFCNYIFEKHQLPLVSNSNAPIFFLGVGLTRMGYNMVKRLMDEGFYTNLGIFPAVPESCTGIRFTMTNHLKIEDIEKFAQKMAYHLPKALNEEGRTMNDIIRAFKKVVNLEEKIKSSNHISEEPTASFKIQRFRSINEINKMEWNGLNGKNGSFDYENLLMLEKIFSHNTEKENNWKFFYYVIRDQNNNIILSTFFTSCLVKDDMLSPEKVSKKIEEERKINPYYLTSKAFMMGSLLTEGKHLYIDKTQKLWKQALTILLDFVWEEQEKQEASILYIRDFREDDIEIRDFFMDHGFVKIETEENNVILNTEKWDSDHFFNEKLDGKKRYYFRNEVLKNNSLFQVKIEKVQKEKINIYYELYKNVKKRKLNINTFDLPIRFFENIGESDNWEVITLDLPEYKKTACVVFCVKTAYCYCPVVIGIDYSMDESLNVYKKALYYMIKRGLELKVDKICLGLSASEAKHKLGAAPIKQVAYVQMKDNFNMSLIESIKLSAV